MTVKIDYILLIFLVFQNSIVKLLPVTHADFISKQIRQRFTNDEENDIWWEQGIVISKDFSHSSDLIINVFDNEDYNESESSLNVYEVLALPLLDDYDFFNNFMFSISSLKK